MGRENLAPKGVQTLDCLTRSFGRIYNGGSFHIVVDPCNMNRPKKNDFKIYSDCIKHNIKFTLNKYRKKSMISKPTKHLMLVTSIFIEPNYVQHSPPGEAKFQPVKKFPDFYGNQVFITAFTRGHHSYCIITYRRQFTINFM